MSARLHLAGVLGVRKDVAPVSLCDRDVLAKGVLASICKLEYGELNTGVSCADRLIEQRDHLGSLNRKLTTRDALNIVPVNDRDP